jgi:hypothetical protein
MTTIVYRDGILAADTRAWSGNKLPIGSKSKIFKLEDGSLFGASTEHVGLGDEFRDWLNSLKGDYTKSAYREFEVQALLITKTRRILYFNCGPRFTGPLHGEFIAIGSGEFIANGALAMGASAEKAVEIAAQFDFATGLPVETLTL